MDYFTLFVTGQLYPFVRKPLAARYQELQRQYHPISSPAAARQQLAAVQQSATINQAWQTPLSADPRRISPFTSRFRSRQRVASRARYRVLMEQLELLKSSMR